MSNPKISLLHPTGNPNARNAAYALHEAGCLHEIITTIAYEPDGALAQLLSQYCPAQLRTTITSELERRTWLCPNPKVIRTHPMQELMRIAFTRMKLQQRLGLKHLNLTDWVYVSLDRHVSHHHLQSINAVYAYEDGACHTFQRAKQQGILCFYDLPIPFYQMIHAIQQEEADCFPELAPLLKSPREPAWKLRRKEQEIQLADHIFVASSVTKQSLIDAKVTPSNVTVIPYGAPIEYFQPQVKPDHQFRVLFVGHLSPKKGVHYLLQSWQSLALPDAELVLLGSNFFPDNWLAPYEDLFTYVPPISHFALNHHYSSASVLVLPSLFEGFGLVLLEAMACGIPVITTENVGGADVLTDGVDGFIIPARDATMLQQTLEWCYRHPQALVEMGHAARRTAETLTWTRYRYQLAHQILERATHGSGSDKDSTIGRT